jgi:GNAT superfamily N-acetyltransferase
MPATEQITLRRGTPDDGLPAYRILFAAINELAPRIGADPIPGDVEESYTRIEPLFRHLAETAPEFWVAEDSKGTVVGYARSIEHGGFFELTEFFVHPDHQSAGIGRRLLERAFAPERGDLRVIVATTDVRALTRYAKAGMTARTVIASLMGSPSAPPDAPGGPAFAVERVHPEGETLADLGALDREIVGFDRKGALAWFAETRDGLLFRRDGQAIGYAFVHLRGIGPVGASDPADLPSILDEVLRRSAELGVETATFEVPMSNGDALRHLLERGLRIDPFLTLLLSNREFGQMDRYVAYSPPIFL